MKPLVFKRALVDRNDRPTVLDGAMVNERVNDLPVLVSSRLDPYGPFLKPVVKVHSDATAIDRWVD